MKLGRLGGVQGGALIGSAAIVLRILYGLDQFRGSRVRGLQVLVGHLDGHVRHGAVASAVPEGRKSVVRNIYDDMRRRGAAVGGSICCRFRPCVRERMGSYN